MDKTAQGTTPMSMDDTASRTGAPVRIRNLMSLHRWTLWSQRPSLIAYCLLAELTALAATLAIASPVNAVDLAILAALTIMGITQAELGRQVERVRRRIAGTPHINMTSVWTFGGVLLLPPALVVPLVAALYWHLHFRSWYRLKRVPAFRTVINSSIVVLTCYITHAVLAASGIAGVREAIHAGWAGVATIAASIGTYFVVNALLIIPALNTTKRTIPHLLGGWGDNLLELATLCLGTLAALAIAAMPALALLVVPPLFILHRAVLTKQLEVAASRDDKTGVWNTAGWHTLADHELARAQRKPDCKFGVLMIDLDYFKNVNDTYGHLAGDHALRTVAATITAAVREYDSVGRFGGEEFVVLLPDITEIDVLSVAERIRKAVADLTVTIGSGSTVIQGLSVSIGVATYPKAGTAVERLVHAADQAMYRAKHTGRNKVVSILEMA